MEEEEEGQEWRESHNNQQLGGQETEQRDRWAPKGRTACILANGDAFHGQESISSAVPGSGTTKPQGEGPAELTPPAGGVLNGLN